MIWVWVITFVSLIFITFLCGKILVNADTTNVLAALAMGVVILCGLGSGAVRTDPSNRAIEHSTIQNLFNIEMQEAADLAKDVYRIRGCITRKEAWSIQAYAKELASKISLGAQVGREFVVFPPTLTDKSKIHWWEYTFLGIAWIIMTVMCIITLWLKITTYMDMNKKLLLDATEESVENFIKRMQKELQVT